MRLMVVSRCDDLVVVGCEVCGQVADGPDLHVRFRLPDPVLALKRRDRTKGVWKNEDDPSAAVMMLVPGLGGFVRALLPVRLTDGRTLTFGVWVGVSPDDLRRAYDVWWAPDYRDLRLEGRLANALPSWEVFGASVTLGVTNPDATPYCLASTHRALDDVLTREWDHEQVLQALPAGVSSSPASGDPVMAMTLRQIAGGEQVVTLVTHEDDDTGGWQFLTADTWREEDLVLVHASHLTDADSSLLDVADLPRGRYAIRTGPPQPWTFGDIDQIQTR